jgi:hypothetical protein
MSSNTGHATDGVSMCANDPKPTRDVGVEVGHGLDDVNVMHRHEISFDGVGDDRARSRSNIAPRLVGCLLTGCSLVSYIAMTVAACASTILIVGVMLEAQCARGGDLRALVDDV